MRYIPKTFNYSGFSYEQASRKALEIVKCAAITGQTSLATTHLIALDGIMQQAKNS